MRHSIKHIDIAPAAEQLEPSLPEVTQNKTFQNAICISLAHFCDEYGRPDANWYAPLYLHFVNDADAMVEISALCKPRTYHEVSDEIGWAVALVTSEQSCALENLPDDEIDGRLVGYLGLEGDDARLWTKRY